MRKLGPEPRPFGSKVHAPNYYANALHAATQLRKYRQKYNVNLQDSQMHSEIKILISMTSKVVCNWVSARPFSQLPPPPATNTQHVPPALQSHWPRTAVTLTSSGLNHTRLLRMFTIYWANSEGLGTVLSILYTTPHFIYMTILWGKGVFADFTK